MKVELESASPETDVTRCAGSRHHILSCLMPHSVAVVGTRETLLLV